MNTNPDAVKVLCYGDSNTHGSLPGVKGSRYPADVRWTGILQGQLGANYEIIEEGLSSRTIDLDDFRPGKFGRNGLTYLMPCLTTHKPINIVILMLGTNDLKKHYNKTVDQVSESLENMVVMIKESDCGKNGIAPQIILVAPILVDDSVDYDTIRDYYLGAGEKSKLLAKPYEEIAKKYGCLFLDASKIAYPDKADGMHLNEEGHKALAEALSKIVKEIA